MKKLVLVFVSVLVSVGSIAQIQRAPIVGEAVMSPSRNIIENASNSKDHTILITALKAAGLMETLQTVGPFTVFAPTNAAFDKLPVGTVETLVKSESKETLLTILRYHILTEKLSAAEILAKIRKGNGVAVLTTILGQKLTVSLKGTNLILTDTKGGISMITIADVNQSNGVIHVIDSVLLPN
jgi:uncharacterized surface protein with fasciclin (FAS1) repeats